MADVIDHCPDAAGLPPVGCPPAGGGTTPIGGDAPVGGLPRDTMAPRLTVTAKRRQRAHRLAITVTADEAARVTVTARVTRRGRRAMRARPVMLDLAARSRRTVRVRFTAAALRSVRRARRPVARVTVRAFDAAGNRGTASRRVRLTGR